MFTTMTHVLVPLDGSAAAEAALEKAFELFPDADVTVLHVTQVTSLPTDSGESVAEIAAAETDELLETAERTAEARGREITTEAIEGHAARTIIGYAETHDVDHIVMGSIGRSGLGRLLLGSVAETVVRRAPCPVTINRAG